MKFRPHDQKCLILQPRFLTLDERTHAHAMSTVPPIAKATLSIQMSGSVEEFTTTMLKMVASFVAVVAGAGIAALQNITAATVPLLLLAVACTMLASQVKQDLAEAASIGTDAIELAVSAGSVTVLATMPVFAVLEILDQISRKELQTLGGIPVLSAGMHKPGKELPVGLVPVPPGGDSQANPSSSGGSYAWVGIIAAVAAAMLGIGTAV